MITRTLRGFGIFARDDTRRFQQRHGFIKNAALGQGNGDHDWTMTKNRQKHRRQQAHGK
jgi:hypothetical protein